MSAAFAAAMLCCYFDMRSARQQAGCIAAGALLGLAVLAKGLVPLALFIPALWFLRRRIRDLALVFLAAICGRRALVCAGHAAQRSAVSRRVFLEASLRPIPEQRAPAWAADLVLRAGLAGRTFPLDPAAGAPVQRATFPRSPRAVSCWPGSPGASSSFRSRATSCPVICCRCLPPSRRWWGSRSPKLARARILLAALRRSAVLSWLRRCWMPCPRRCSTGISHASFHSDLAWIFPRCCWRLPLSARVNRRDAASGVAWWLLYHADRRMHGLARLSRARPASVRQGSRINDLPASDEPFPALQHRLLCRQDLPDCK